MGTRPQDRFQERTKCRRQPCRCWWWLAAFPVEGREADEEALLHAALEAVDQHVVGSLAGEPQVAAEGVPVERRHLRMVRDVRTAARAADCYGLGFRGVDPQQAAADQGAAAAAAAAGPRGCA